MLTTKTKNRILEHKWSEHSNTSQFFRRIRNQSHGALKDLALLANELEEPQLRELFNEETLAPFIRALMNPQPSSGEKFQYDIDRRFFIGYTLLHWSLNITGVFIDNRWAKEMYSEHEIRLREILEALNYERRRKLQLSV